jgi:tetratricopeptide (TPR) repeat protein
VHCPFFSLPLAFGTRVDTVPQNIPYLFVDSEKKKQWQERLGPKTKPRIGLVWSGATGHVNDAKRSIPLKLLAPLLKGNYEYHSLQKEYRKNDEAFLATTSIISHASQLNDFTDTAALISELDMVISVDTSVAHMTGAIGKPLFLLLAYTPDYRWMMDRDDTPWYPTARLFRQQKFGDWESVIAQVAAKLNISPEEKPRPDLLAKAISLHGAGNLKEAQSIYEDLLKLSPHYVEVLTLYGIMHAQMGEMEKGLQLVEKAIALNPAHAEAHANRAIILQSLGRSEEALQSYDKAIECDSRYTDAYINRGVILSSLHRYQEAVASYDKAITLNSNDPTVHYSRANALRELAQYEEAVASYDKAIAMKPDYAEAYNNRGLVALKLMDRYSEALASFDKAIELNANYGEAYDNRAVALRGLNQFEEALKSHDEAIALKPDHAIAYDNRGATLQELNRHMEALESFNRAIALKPDYAEAHNSKGFILQKLGQYREAMESFNTAISLKADYADAYWNKAVLHLQLGEFKEGWPLYEWRWKSANRKGFRAFSEPLWLGKESLKGKTLLVHAEQGLGDTIQLCRFIPQLESLGAKILLEVPASLVGLISSLKGTYQLVVQGAPLPVFDFHCPLFSLPLALGTTLENIPATIPYLYANEAKLQIWQHRLGVKTKPRIGLVWSGDAKHQNDRNRSIPLHTILPLLSDAYEFHCLQKEVRPADAAKLAQTRIILHGQDLKDFSDTAALVSKMDLVISIDTSVAHLAGALGKECWILLPFAPDYRWLNERQDSPWYPRARLFRQHVIGDWNSVLAEVKKVLSEKPFPA